MTKKPFYKLITVSALALAISACGGAPQNNNQAASVNTATSTQASTQEAATPAWPNKASEGAAESHASNQAAAYHNQSNHVRPTPNNKFWPEQIDLTILRENAAKNDPMDGFNYAKEFASLDMEAVKKDLIEVMTTSQDWWPADYGTYGPFFIRLAWHSAGTYRTTDGRGGAGAGQQRFEPLNSWPDNTNLDKAQRLLWPIKQKYGRKISWADLIVLSGTIAMESMGFQTYGFAGGREDAWTPDLVYWGPENEFLASERYNGDRKLQRPLAASRLGLIYVNPEGPNGTPDPLAAAKDIRETFGRMAMNDEETVALIAGGHTFGKAHGAAKPDECVGPEPASASIEEQGLGWKNKCGTGKGADTITSGLEGAWTSSPAYWTTQYLDNLFKYEWVETRSPAGAIQWIPKDGAGDGTVPDAHDNSKTHAPIMFTTDLSLKFDPAYREVSQRFQQNPALFEQAFARAWFKLTHRDMGPRARYLGADVPDEALSWQDPIPQADHPLVNNNDIDRLKADILNADLSVSELVRTAWASAATYRDTDKRGGANGARIRLAPQKDWAVNNPAEIQKVINGLEKIQGDFNAAQAGDKRISLADLIVLGGTAAVEKAAKDAGHTINIDFAPGRGDAAAEQTDVEAFSVLEPEVDGFRNYAGNTYDQSVVDLLIDRSDLLNLTAPEMTALVGGLRVLNANTGGAKHGVFTNKPGTLSNDFFVNLLDVNTQWKPSTGSKDIYEGFDPSTGETKWSATAVDLVFGSNSQLRAIAESYAYADAEKVFVEDFAKAWSKVMHLDRFDIN